MTTGQEYFHLILDFVQSMAWPAVATMALLVFRKPLSALLDRLKSAELPGGLSLDFNQGVQEVRVLSSAVAKEPPKHEHVKRGTPLIPATEANARMIELDLQPSPSGLDLGRYADLAKQDPNLALAGLRIELDIIARNLAKGFNLECHKTDTANTLIRRLHDASAITSGQRTLVLKILELCNKAVHGLPVSQDAADTVIESVAVLREDYLAWLSWGFDGNWIAQPD